MYNIYNIVIYQKTKTNIQDIKCGHKEFYKTIRKHQNVRRDEGQCTYM